MTNTPAMNRYSWYGKLPSAGDFLQRRFPDTLQRQWSHWFQVGLLAWQQEEQRSGERPFQKAPVWNFAWYHYHLRSDYCILVRYG